MEKKRSLEGFDIIKIIAATLIVFHHYQQVFKVRFSGINFYEGVFNFGYLVELFFIISGFLALYTHTHNTRQINYHKAFWHKLLRIYPMTTLAFVVTLLVKSVASDQLAALWNFKAIISNLFLLFSGYPYFSMTGINNPTWYLCILIQCYAVFYLMMWFLDHINNERVLNNQKLALACLLMVALSFVLNICNLITWSSFRGIESFFLGVLLCAEKDTAKKYIGSAQIKKAMFLCGILLFVAACIFQRFQSYILVFGVYPILVMMAYFGGKMKSAEIIRRASQVSFEVFIWHYPIMAIELMIVRLTGTEITRSYCSMILFACFAWIVSWLLHIYVEVPINKRIKEIGANH